MEKVIDVLYAEARCDHRSYTNHQQINHMLWAAIWRNGHPKEKEKLSKQRMKTDKRVIQTLETMMAIEAFNKAVRGLEKKGIDVDTILEYKKI